jgi:hypothetical protein
MARHLARNKRCLESAGVESFAKGFARNPDGSWRCIAPVSCITAEGATLTCTPGTTYRRGHLVQGVDVAAWLHNWHQFRLPPPGASFPEEPGP